MILLFAATLIFGCLLRREILSSPLLAPMLAPCEFWLAALAAVTTWYVVLSL